MATAIYPEFNKLTTQMGGEGAPWIGASAFSQVPHVFANLGDGTYYHSGYLAIRAAVAANRTMPVNITYKVLYNDAVAMTGGQPVDGPIGVREIARQLSAEGVQPHRRRHRRPGPLRRSRPACPGRPPCTTAPNSTRCNAPCATCPA